MMSCDQARDRLWMEFTLQPSLWYPCSKIAHCILVNQILNPIADQDSSQSDVHKKQNADIEGRLAVSPSRLLLKKPLLLHWCSLQETPELLNLFPKVIYRRVVHRALKWLFFLFVFFFNPEVFFFPSVASITLSFLFRGVFLLKISAPIFLGRLTISFEYQRLQMCVYRVKREVSSSSFTPVRDRNNN